MQQPQPDRTLFQRVVLFWSTLGFTDVLLFRVGALAFLALDYYFGQQFWKYFPMMISGGQPLPGVLAGAFQIGFSAVQILLLEQIFTLFKRVYEGVAVKDWEKAAWFAFACLFLLFSFAMNVLSNFVAFRLGPNPSPQEVATIIQDSFAIFRQATSVTRWLWAGGALLIAVLGEMLWELAGQVAEDRSAYSHRAHP